jgi:hypothetical protein
MGFYTRQAFTQQQDSCRIVKNVVLRFGVLKYYKHTAIPLCSRRQVLQRVQDSRCVGERMKSVWFFVFITRQQTITWQRDHWIYIFQTSVAHWLHGIQSFFIWNKCKYYPLIYASVFPVAFLLHVSPLQCWKNLSSPHPCYIPAQIITFGFMNSVTFGEERKSWAPQNVIFSRLLLLPFS